MASLWVHAAPVALAAFVASVVEAVEALTIILAVGTTRGWRDALLGTAAALLVLAALIAALGPALAALPLAALQLGIGGLLLLFGLRWLRKAVLRGAGVLALHDEALAFTRERQRLAGLARAGSWDAVAFAAAFQIVILEGAEVVVIVLGSGAGDPVLLRAAIVGAAAAVVLVAAAGVAARRALAEVPENQMKFAVGVLLAGFGTFWFGEGTGLAWPGGDLALPVLALGYLAVALLAVRLCTMTRRGARA